MNKVTKNKLLALGFSTELINKIAEKGLTVSGLTGQSEVALTITGFTSEEAAIINNKVKRRSIPAKTIKNVLFKSGEVCCFCADGNNTRPYQIHHIEEYHVRQNNDDYNLLLVCPTHHVYIHQNKTSPEEQMHQRRAWESILQIANGYQKQGIPFPFNSFYMIDYDVEGSVIEIFSFTEPRPSVCKRLLQQEIWKEVKEILDSENRLIVIGDSGSGKSTLAKGVAGRLEGFTVFSYLIGNDPKAAVQEIYTFLLQAVKPIVLLIDDANARLNNDHIERVLKAATAQKKIIIVNTNNSFGENGNLEQHFLNCVLKISWNQLRSTVKRELANNALEILQYLKSKGLNFFKGQKIGHGSLEYRLSSIIDQYSSSINSVWELVFLLGSGSELMGRIYDDLVRQDRLDLIVLLISVNQIGQVENGTTFEEILEFYSLSPTLKKKSSPEKRWLEEKLSELIKKRILKIERGRYNTIHRLFAKKIIEHSYPRAVVDTQDLLSRIFNDSKRVKETLLLWNWLEDSTLLSFIREVHCSLELDDWQNFVDETINDGLVTVSMLADRMNVVCTNRDSPLMTAFSNKYVELASLINSGDSNALIYFSRAIRHLSRNSSDTVLLILERINIEHFECLIKEIAAEYLEEIDWMCNALIGVDAVWVKTLCDKFSHADLMLTASRIKKGDIDSLFNVVGFQRRYVANITRNQFKEYAIKFAELLNSCGLEEMYYSPTLSSPFLELEIFPSDLDLILNSLDKERLAKDFTTCSPRHWGKLLSLSFISTYATTTGIKDMLEAIDVEALRKNIRKYYIDYHYELRVLIYQLCYASDEKKKQFSSMLEPFIEDILELTNSDDVNDVFVAYSTLDPAAGSRLSKKRGRPMPQVPEMTNTANDEFRKKAKELDDAGEDYELMPTKFTVIRKGEESRE